MDAFEAVSTKLDVREFGSKHVPGDVKRKILEAARLTSSGMNSQHWRFILVQDRSNLKTLAAVSSTGKWVGGADFAIIILIDPKMGSVGSIDAGRVLQDMELAAWNFGVASGVYVGLGEPSLRKAFAVPNELKPAAVLGFGFPKRKLLGKKSRKPLEELVSVEKFGRMFEASDLS